MVDWRYPLWLGHKNIINYCNRPFSSVEEMNNTLIKNWNSVVNKHDKVIVAGDFALCGKDKIIEIGQKLNGKKTLILGNHDRASINTYYEAGFEFVSKYPIILDEWYIISHQPKFTPEIGGLYANIYAHVHNDTKYRDYTAMSFCVSAERINYTPIEWEVIKERMVTYEKENYCRASEENQKFLEWCKSNNKGYSR